MDAPENLAGHMLVAHPLLRDPHFREAVVFITSHDSKEGAYGFILNRPVESPEQELEACKTYDGGPVEKDGLFLASLCWRECPPGVDWRLFSKEDSHEAGECEGLRIFAGYAGWSPGQLEQEISQGTWAVFPPQPRMIDLPPSTSLWRDLIREASPHLHLLAEAPEDPGLN